MHCDIGCDLCSGDLLAVVVVELVTSLATQTRCCTIGLYSTTAQNDTTLQRYSLCVDRTRKKPGPVHRDRCVEVSRLISQRVSNEDSLEVDGGVRVVENQGSKLRDVVSTIRFT
jgi:hypothetical protein